MTGMWSTSWAYRMNWESRAFRSSQLFASINLNIIATGIANFFTSTDFDVIDSPCNHVNVVSRV